MRNYILLLTFFTLILPSCSKKLTTVSHFPKENFPQAWIGNWSGELFIYNSKGIKQKIPMSLEIATTDDAEKFSWSIIYGPDKIKGKRAYELNIKDVEKGWYVIDEKNSILLDAFLFHNKLYSRFEVMGNLLLCTYQKQGEQIIFEVISGNEKAMNITGGEQIKKEKIPDVKSFSINVSQQAILKKE